MSVKPYFCIYHGNCADGFGAAWAVRHALGEDRVDFFPGYYGKPLPDSELTEGKHVLLVDFSYKRPQLEELALQSRTVTVLDHHVTAKDDLREFTDDYFVHLPKVMEATFEEFRAHCEKHDLLPIRALFDMNRSGAGLAWDWFHPNDQRPEMINVLEDRDLWRFDKEPWKTFRPYTRAIQAVIFSHEYDFLVWDMIATRLMYDSGLQSMRLEGEAIERKLQKDVAELVKLLKRRIVIDGHRVWAASLPHTYTSEAGHMMAEGEPFAACYWDTADGRVFSLRSTDKGIDVSKVAKRFGGGGHRNAAGFTVPFSRLSPDGSPALAEPRP